MTCVTATAVRLSAVRDGTTDSGPDDHSRSVSALVIDRYRGSSHRRWSARCRAPTVNRWTCTSLPTVTVMESPTCSTPAKGTAERHTEHSEHDMHDGGAH